MIDRLQFREEIANHRNRLENIHISPNDSKTTEIDISPLVQAKSTFIFNNRAVRDKIEINHQISGPDSTKI